MERSPSKSVSSLLISMFSGMTDEHGHGLVPPEPLPFDVVLEGRPAASSASLFSLPSELLTEIISHLQPASLGNLAFVNSDCRQLVRSRRFASIWLDFGPKSMQILQWLSHEAKERSRHSGITKTPTIGSCVRRILVATHPFFLRTNYDLDYDLLTVLGKEQGREEFRRRDERASNFYFNHYMKVIEQVLRTALPHLQLLDWEDMISLPPSMYRAISHSSVDHLKLRRIPLDKDSELPLESQFPAAGWPLRTLHLELMPEMFTNIDGSTAKLSAEILRSAAPYLESLVWLSSISENDPQTFSDDACTFPRLLDLELGYHNFIDESILESFIPAGSKTKLQTLVINPGRSEICNEYFDKRGVVPSLKNLVWEDFKVFPENGLNFIKDNPQLRKLSMPYSTSHQLLENTLLPLLTDAFKNLVSLRLTWEGTSIPESGLEAIGSISNLEQLCLSAGNQFGWKTDWRINHKTMRKHLSNLPHLKKLAFSRDSYLLEASDEVSDAMISQMVEGYYEHKYISRGRNDVEQSLIDGLQQRRMVLSVDMEARKKVRERMFELIHRRRMLATANRYAYCMDQLEWIYIGQLPMEFTTGWLEFGMGFQGPRRVAMALSDERDDCWTLLSRMFGRNGTVIETMA